MTLFVHVQDGGPQMGGPVQEEGPMALLKKLIVPVMVLLIFGISLMLGPYTKRSPDHQPDAETVMRAP